MNQSYFLLFLYVCFFTFLAWRNLHLALGLLFFLLPTYLIRFQFGPLPTTLLEVMLLIITAVWIVKDRLRITYHISHIIREHRSLFIAIAVFLLAATISVFTGMNTRAALGEWKAFYVEPIIIFFILISLESNQGEQNECKMQNAKCKITSDSHSAFGIQHSALTALILSGLLTSILAIYQHFTGWGVPWDFWENRGTYRVTAWYGFPNAVGLFLAPLVPLAMYMVRQSWERLKQYRLKTYGGRHMILFLSSVFYLPSSVLAILFAKSTGALVGIIAGLGVLLLQYKKTRLIACLAGLVGIVGLVSLPPTNPIRQEILAQDRSGQIRVEMWGETVQYLSEHPILGAGLASYTEVIAPYRINKRIEIFHHPHNIFLTMWANLGILGVIGFVWIMVWFFRNAKCKMQNAEGRIVPFLLVSMVTLLITGLVDSPYIKNDLAIFFWMLIAILTIVRREKNSAF